MTEFKMVIATYMNLQYCKHMLVNKMEQVKKLNLFVDRVVVSDEVTNDEGYVAVSNDGQSNSLTDGVLSGEDMVTEEIYWKQMFQHLHWSDENN